MIKYIKRCMGEEEIILQEWDEHLAALHITDFNNIFVNGKELKPSYIFKDGDLVEEVIQPKDVVGILGVLVLNVILHPFIAAGIAVVAGVGIGLAASALVGGTSGAVSATGSKEYESSSNPEIKGSNNSISDSIIPYVFGRTQQTHNYGQKPFKRVSDGGSTNKYLQYFLSNYNNVVYSDFKLGETPTSNYSVDFLDITTSYGGSSFIGFDNVKAVSIDEQLSYNSDEEVFETATHTYNETTTSTTLQIDFEVLFTDVDTTNWADKEFQLVANVVDDTPVSVELTEDYTIAVGDLVSAGITGEYAYTGTKTWTQNITELTDTAFQPTADTRGNSTEVTNELDCLYTDQTITTDDFTEITEIDQSCNKYTGAVSEVIETSPANTNEVDIIISFPQGLYTQTSTGGRVNRTSVVDIEYKNSTDVSWQPISDANSLYIRDLDGVKQPLSSSTTTVSGSKVTVNSPPDLNDADALFFRTIGMNLDNDTYAIRVRSADFADKTNFDAGVPYCNEIHFYVDDDVLDTSILPNVNQIAFEATAYKGLSGKLKKFNTISEAKIPIWDGTDWSTTDKTTNAAAIIRDLFTSSLINPRAESIDSIDNDSLVELYEWCEAQEYKASGIVSDSTKVEDVISNILANCQATMIPLLDGKHTFTIDNRDETKIPLSLFNQHNSWNFVWNPNLGRKTEAVRASFLNNDDFTEDELTVYYYDGAVYEEPESGKSDIDYEIVKKEYEYVNDYDSVLKIAKYDLITVQEKRNVFEFTVNLESVNLRLYDRAFVSNTVNMQNEVSGLIKSVNLDGANLTGFTLYSEIDIPEDSKIVIRSLDNVNKTPKITTLDVTNQGNTDIVNIDSIAYDGVIQGKGEITGLEDTWQYDGDLFTLGQETIYDCIIIGIKNNENSTATITARDY